MYDDCSLDPTTVELALLEEERLFRAMRQSATKSLTGVTHDARATERLTSTWHTMVEGIRESTRRITEARMNLPSLRIADALAAGADPNAIKAQDLIAYLPVIGASVHQGPIQALELLTQLVRAGYRMRGSEIDALTRAFGQRLAIHLSGANWLAAGCPEPVFIPTPGVTP